MGSRNRLLPRWYSSLGNINVIISSLRELLPDTGHERRRGRPPKRSIKDYLILIVIKELKKASLRATETDWSKSVCEERVDHSVIHYWEKNLRTEVIEQTVRIIGSELEEMLGYDFSVIDATSFSDWHHNTSGFHLLNRICKGAVYPVSMHPDSFDPVPNTRDTIVPGHGLFMGDAWYDVNRVYRIIYRHGYTPLVSPNKDRDSGCWRRKARKVYSREWRRYRQRGRGESVFGSLTNAFGDRLHTRLKETTYIRSAARVVAYQVRIYIRARHGSCSCVDLFIW